MATVTLHGTETHTNGELPLVGSTTPDFVLVDGKLNNVSLDTYQGKKKLFNIVPSLDTPTCALSTKKFNEAAKNKTDTVFLVVSGDLPFAMSRFCGAEGTDNVIPLSMMRSRNFAKDYGVLIDDGPLAGITARAIVVADEKNKVIYTQLVPEIGEEPDYKSALAALG